MITLHNGNETIELLTNDDSYSYEAVMGEDTLTLYFSHPGYLDIPVGSWCEFYGKRYSLKKDSDFKKSGERNYEYTLVLETSKADTGLWKIRNMVDNRIKFPYTAKPKEHLKLIVDNLNRRSSGWVIGECIEGTEKLFNYNHTYALDAINQLAKAFETEWQITETVIEGIHTKTVHLRKVEYNKDTPLTLSYGKGHGFKVGVGRESGDVPPEIILVETTDRNIDYSRYGAKELLMPKSQTIRFDGTHFEGEEGFNAAIVRTYKTDEYGTSVMRADKDLITAKEDSLDCTEIYPSRVGTVSEVITVEEKGNTFYDFKDKDSPAAMDFSQYRIDGERATVIFQSGMLSGKEFELEQTDKALTGYVHSERRFKLVSQEIDGITMPDGGVWMPKAGDKYAVFGIQLPEAYICDNDTKTGASWDVFREAAKYLYEHENKEFTFTGTLDGIWAKKRWLQIGSKIVLGGFVNFTDSQFHPEGSLIRMTGIKRYVNNPYSPEIELSNSPVGTSISSDLNKIETNEVTVGENHKKALQFTKRQFRDARETMEMLAGSLLNFSGSINPITVATMQMLVGDESLQFRFVTSRTNPVVVNHDISYNPSTKVLSAHVGIIQHMTLGIDEIKPAHAVSDYKFWDMAEYDSPVLADPSKKFYLYARCNKDNQSGIFLLSESAVGLEQVAGCYHLLVGILNSEDNGERSFAAVYGFTEILPGRITTDKIVSSDGNTYFDLLKSEMGGKIKFLSGSSGLKNLEEWEAVSKDISDASTSAGKANDAVSDLNKYVDGAFTDGIITEAEAKAIEKYINVVKSAKADMEATYNRLYVNGYLSGTPKTDLLNAKVLFFGAVDNLLTAINDAIADERTTVEEKQNVDGKYVLFNSAYSSMSQAIETANKAIQDVLKGYSDEALKSARDAAKAASDAQGSANDARDAVTDLNGYVDGAFADGVIEESEAKAIEKYINIVKSTRADVEATYNKLYANSYLEGDAKTGLLNAKITLFGAIDALLASVNTAIADEKTTPEEKQDVDSKYAVFNSACSSMSLAIETANKAIQDTLKTYSTVAKDAADAAQATANAAQSAAATAQQSVTDLNGYVDGAFADGIITEAEAKAVEKYINTVNNTKSAVEATYNKLYSNVYLDGSARTDLLNAKITLFGAIDNLMASINAAIADGQTDISEKQDVDNRFVLFNSSLSLFNSAVEAANQAIQGKLKDYSDAAQSTADNALTAAGNAERNAKDHIAQSIGYDNYAALENAARDGETIIDGGKINTTLINAEAILTASLLAKLIKTTELIAEHFTLTGGKIGAFDVVNNVLANVSDNPKASIQIEKNGGKFFRVNSISGSAMCDIRGDGIRALSIQGYGDGSVGINVIAQAGMDSKAINSYGDVEFHTRDGESSLVQGLRMNVRFITSSCAIQSNDDFLRFTANVALTVTMPSASVNTGKVYYIKITAGNVTFTGGNFRGPGDWNTATSFNHATSAFIMLVSDGSVWNIIYGG